MEGNERQGKAAKVFSSSAEDKGYAKFKLRKIIDRRDYQIEAVEILS